MNNNLAVKVENVAKKYCKSLKRSMLYGIADIGRNIIGLSSHPEILRKNEFWAIKEVSFELKKGEVFGVIGPNGSGKTTLLKMLNGIFWPDKGKITIFGRVGALIEVGAGFHPMLTGRENVYVNAAILGMTKKEVDKKFDDIVKFADIGEFIDSPVKKYSSGMLVRLGFAIAVYCEPDILLIDEILAVGDIGFRTKCYNKIAELKKNCAIILVSHNMSAISRTTSRCIVLNSGEKIFYGESSNAIQVYHNLFKEVEKDKIPTIKNSIAKINSFEILNHLGEKSNEFYHGERISVVLNMSVRSDYSNFTVSINFFNFKNEFVAQCHSGFNDVIFNNKNDEIKIKVEIPNLVLNPGEYKISAIIFEPSSNKYLAWYPELYSFIIKGGFFGKPNIQLIGKWGQIK